MSKKQNISDQIIGDETKAGEFYQIHHELWETCCSCSLRHHTLFFRKDKKGDLVPNNEALYLLSYRDEAVTEVLRNEAGIKVTKKKSKPKEEDSITNRGEGRES